MSDAAWETTASQPHRYHGKTARSASICATGSKSMEAIATAAAATANNNNNSNNAIAMASAASSPRRRKPAARSQSARVAGGRSVRIKKTTATANNATMPTTALLGGAICNSEPRLVDQTAGATDASPGIRRKNSTRRGTSVYHRKSTAFLDVPDNKSGFGNAHQDEDEDSYRLRSFSFTSKGAVVNRGDSFRRRRSRSNSLVPPQMLSEQQQQAGGARGEPPQDVASYQVALVGAQGVGKTALISQFQTSECINAYERQRETGDEQSVFIMLNGEESELSFLNITTPWSSSKLQQPSAFLVVYSVVDKASFLRAEDELNRLAEADVLRHSAVILVGNKVDLARSRAVSPQDGKCMACTYRVKYIEISVGINHNVDELLVGILNQIRLKAASCQQQQPQQSKDLHHHHHNHQQQQWFRSRGVVKVSMKARQMLTWLFGKEDSKFKNCENLHTL